VRQFEWKLGLMLVYDQPINQAKSDARQVSPRAFAGFSVLDLIRLLWQRKVAIAAAGLICACAAVMIGKSLTPKYSATAQLYVDPRELQLVDRELTPRAQDTSGLAMVVESQARLITSNNVLLQVIQDTHLDKDPEFGGDSRSMMASLLGLFGLDSRSADGATPGQMAALEALFNFLSGSRARAPQWMQAVGLEWAWRIWLEPRRLFWRYLTTNPRALYLLFNRNRPSVADRTPRS
jgi:hypothetical protein